MNPFVELPVANVTASLNKYFSDPAKLRFGENIGAPGFLLFGEYGSQQWSQLAPNDGIDTGYRAPHSCAVETEPAVNEESGEGFANWLQWQTRRDYCGKPYYQAPIARIQRNDGRFGSWDLVLDARGQFLFARFQDRDPSAGWLMDRLDDAAPYIKAIGMKVLMATITAGVVDAYSLLAPPPTESVAMFDFFDAPSDFNVFDAPIDYSMPADDFVSQIDMEFPSTPLEIDMPSYDYFDESYYGPGGISEPSPPSMDVEGPAIDSVNPDTTWVPGEEVWTPDTPWSGDSPVPTPEPPSTQPSINQTYPSNVTFPAPQDWMQGLNSQMVQALKALQTANQLISVLKNPRGPQPGQPGSSRTVRPDGTVTVRDQNGRTINQRTAVGVGELAADGSVVVNNGNGTFTRITPDGRTETKQYPSNLSVIPQMAQQQMVPLLLLGGAALFFLMKRK